MVGCQVQKVAKQPCKDGTADCQYITIHELSLSYTMMESVDQLSITIRTEDPRMVARIMALGITLKVRSDQPSERLSINYPIGVMELRSFNSIHDLRRFWNRTNTPQIWESRLKRTIGIIHYSAGNDEFISHIDSLSNGIKTHFDWKNRQVLYRLTIPKKMITNPVEIELTIGQLFIAPRLIRRSARIHPTFHFIMTDYISSFVAPWELTISSKDS